jgi:hypothetical protein
MPGEFHGAAFIGRPLGGREAGTQESSHAVSSQ